MFLKNQPTPVLLLCAILCQVTAAPGSASGDDAASQYNSQGIEAYRSGKLDESEKMYRNALRELDTNNGSDQMRATVLNNLSFVLRKQGREDEAKAAEEKADRLRGPAPRKDKGTAGDAHRTELDKGVRTPHAETPQAPSAPKIKEKGSQARPTSDNLQRATSLVAQGTILIKKGQNQEAVEDLRHAVELAPTMAEAHRILGIALAKTGNSKEGIEEVKKAMLLQPGAEEPLLTLGNLYQTSGDIGGTVATYKEYLRLFPHGESAPKVKNLVQALEKESEHMYPGHGSVASASFNPDSNSDEDYYAEMIKGGVHRWPASKMPLKVHITSGTGVEGYRPQFESILSECFEDWSTASVGRIQFVFVPNADDCDIDCNWTDAATTLNSPAEQGEAATVYDHKGISSSKIHLLTLRPSSGSELTDNQMRTVCLHEIGHALGLLKHTANPSDVMFFTSSPKDERKELSTRDRNTIIKLYSTSSENP